MDKLTTERINIYLGEQAQEINEDFYLNLVRRYGEKFEDFESPAWKRMVAVGLKSMWWIFVHRS